MAQVLKQIFTSGSDQISQNYVIESWHVSQSIDAFTGTKAYNITLSGSFTLTGSQLVSGSISASLGANTVGFHGTSSWAVTSSQAVSASYAISSSYATSASYAISSSYATSASYAISSSVAISSSYALSSSYATSASYAISSSYATSASYAISSSVAISSSYALSSSIATFSQGFIPKYFGIDDVTYTASSPFPVAGNTPYNIYISQSFGNILGLDFGSANDGQIVNFAFSYGAGTLNGADIAITASSANVYGIGGSSISTGNKGKLNTGLGINSANSLTFQYINVLTPSTIFPTSGWYLSNYNQS